MKIDDFEIEFLEIIEEAFPDFKRNMKRLNVDNKSFCEWVKIFIAWIELSDIEDCTRYYEK